MDTTHKERTLLEQPQKLTIAVADDDVGQRAVLEQYFGHQGHRVHSFDDGEKLLYFLFTTTDSVDLVVSDNAMEVMDGIEVLERIRAVKAFQNTPFIIRTGSPERLKSLAAQYGGAVVSKNEPLRLGLASAVTQALESISARARKV